MSAKAVDNHHHLSTNHYQPHPHTQHYDAASPASASASSAPVSAGPSRPTVSHHSSQYMEPAPRMSSKKSQSRERGRGTSSLGGQSVEPEDPNRPKDRHEPRGRKPNDQLPPSRAREVQRAFRLRRAEHLAALEERINLLEAENSQLRALLSLPEAERERIGSGPTGRGKSLKEGGVPMSERVRARKEARARERRMLGLPEPLHDSSGEEDDGADTPSAGGRTKRLRETSTMSPRGVSGTPGLPGLNLPSGHGMGGQSGAGVNGNNLGQSHGNGNGSHHSAVQQYQLPTDTANVSTFGIPNFNVGGMAGFNMTLPTPDNPFGDFESAIFKSHQHQHQQSQSAGSPSFASMFSLYDEGGANSNGASNAGQSQTQAAPQYSRNVSHTGSAVGRSPISPPASAPANGGSANASGSGIGVGSGPMSTSAPDSSPSASTAMTTTNTTSGQPDLLVRLRQCCHLSDSHVVNDPGLLIFATRLCQSFPCQFGGAHAEGGVAISDSEHLLLDDSWKLLRNQLDPGTELDGEHRINTGRMAAELVIRAAHSRGPGGWIVCRYTQGMSVKRALVAGLIQGLGGQFE